MKVYKGNINPPSDGLCWSSHIGIEIYPSTSLYT